MIYSIQFQRITSSGGAIRKVKFLNLLHLAWRLIYTFAPIHSLGLTSYENDIVIIKSRPTSSRSFDISLHAAEKLF